MNRRGFFSRLAMTCTAVAVASSMEVFGALSETPLSKFHDQILAIQADFERRMIELWNDKWEVEYFRLSRQGTNLS